MSSMSETINAVTDVQLHRYKAATLELAKQLLESWAVELSTPQKPVIPYFIVLGFQDIKQQKKQRFFNRIPTSFALDDEQVDELIEAGRNLLLANSVFKQLLADLETEAGLF